MTSQEYQLPEKLERAVDEVDLLVASGMAEITLDFQAVDWISVEGLEWLEELLLRADSSQVKVRFVQLRPPVYKVLKVAHIDSLLKACGSMAYSGPAC